MRISDWSSDVCSSDLFRAAGLDGSLYQGFRAEGRPDPQQTSPRMGAGDGGRPQPGDSGQVRPDAGPARKPGERPTVDALRSGRELRSEEHTSELQSLMRLSSAVFCLKKKTNNKR